MNALQAHDAELLAVGESWCLFQPATRAAVLLNAVAAGGVTEVLSGAVETPGALRLRTELEASGFRLEASAGTVAGPQRRGEPLPSIPSEAPSAPVWRQSYALATGEWASVSSNDQSLADLLRAALAPLETGAATRNSRSQQAELVASRTGESFAIWRDGMRVAAGLSLGDVRRMTIESLIVALWPASRVSAILHASGVVTENGQTVLLAGATGSGKTTLTLRLVAKGARLLGDDLLPLDVCGTEVAAFPAAASVKSGSWPLVGADFPELHQLPVFQLGDRDVRYLHRAGSACAAGVTSVPDILVFPRFEAGSEVSVTTLSPEEALARFLESGTAIVGWPRSLRPLVKLVETTPAIALRHSDRDEAARAIATIIETRT